MVAGARACRRTRSACPQEGTDAAIVDPETGVELPVGPVRRRRPAAERRRRPSARSSAATSSTASRATTRTPRPTPSAPATGGTGRATSATATADGHLLLRRPGRGVAARRRRELRHRPGRADPRPVHPACRGVAVYAVPDERTADDQVMAAVELADGRDVRPRGLRRLPRRAARPRHQVGAALRPHHARCRSTATNKIDKKPLQDRTLVHRRPDLLASRSARRLRTVHARRSRRPRGAVPIVRPPAGPGLTPHAWINA